MPGHSLLELKCLHYGNDPTGEKEGDPGGLLTRRGQRGTALNYSLYSSGEHEKAAARETRDEDEAERQ